MHLESSKADLGRRVFASKEVTEIVTENNQSGLQADWLFPPALGLPLTPLVLGPPGNQKRSAWIPPCMIPPVALDMPLQRVDPKNLGRREAGEPGGGSLWVLAGFLRGSVLAD